MNFSKSLVVQGGIPLVGDVRVSGSKHAALHLLGAALIAGESVVFENFPDIADARNMISIYESFGIRSVLDGGILRIGRTNCGMEFNTSQLYKASLLRSSILLLGSALLRLKHITFSFPGGDYVGLRDFAMFFKALAAFNIEHGVRDGMVWAKAESKLQGDREFDIRVDPRTEVSGNNSTALAMILAAANEGATRITGALNVQETRVLANFLSMLGASVNGLGTRTTTIISPGLSHLNREPIKIRLPADKTEFAFWIVAASMTMGRIDIQLDCAEQEVANERIWYQALVKNALEPLGLSVINTESNHYVIDAAKGTRAPADLRARYTGIEAEIVDAMPLFVPILAVTPGTSTWSDTHVGRARLGFVSGLRKMGAKLKTHGDGLTIDGVPALVGQRVTGNDSRSAAALLLAALGATGPSTVRDFDKVERVFDSIPTKLSSLGGSVHFGSSSEF